MKKEPPRLIEAQQIKERKHAIATAGYWFRWARKAQEEGNMSEALIFMENAYNHTEGALVALRRLHGYPLSDE
jgi:hypothetical protein